MDILTEVAGGRSVCRAEPSAASRATARLLAGLRAYIASVDIAAAKANSTAPDDGSAFSVEVVASSLTDKVSSVADITPRHRVEQSIVEFSPTSPGCDTDFELEAERRVTRTAPQHPTKSWEFDRWGQYFDDLPDSSLTFEVAAANAGSINDRAPVRYRRQSTLQPTKDERSEAARPSFGPRLVAALPMRRYSGRLRLVT